MSVKAIIIDSREPPNIQALKFGDVPTMITALQCGDVWASCDDGAMIIVERKTPSDLLGSIKDGRLFQQVAAMVIKSKWSYLCVTGALAHTHSGHVLDGKRVTGWGFDEVMGALISVQEMGVTVVTCQSDAHYEEAVLRLARRDRREVKPLQPRVQGVVISEQEKVLTSLPGIGLERAGLLLGDFESAAHSIAWLSWLNSFAEMSGIGDKTKHGVRRALGLKPEEWLSVMTEEKSKEAAAHLKLESEPTVDMAQQEPIPF